jgi:hypothetical protein
VVDHRAVRPGGHDPNAILASTDWNGVYWELFGFIAALCSSSSATACPATRSGWSVSSPANIAKEVWPWLKRNKRTEIDRTKMTVSDEVAIEIRT